MSENYISSSGVKKLLGKQTNFLRYERIMAKLYHGSTLLIDGDNGGVVDQTYDATSANAQSGTAVASAISGKQDALVSGTNIKTINNTSLLGSGNISISTSPSIDNKSITTNGSSQLQTIGVINQRDTTAAVKIWVGTEAQYSAITTKDANTLYFKTES